MNRSYKSTPAAGSSRIQARDLLDEIDQLDLNIRDKSHRQKPSQTTNIKPKIVGFDNQYFKDEVQKFINRRSPSPMHRNILPDDITDDDDQNQSGFIYGNKRKVERSKNRQ